MAAALMAFSVSEVMNSYGKRPAWRALAGPLERGSNCVYACMVTIRLDEVATVAVKADDCELWANKTWIRITAAQGGTYRERKLRCIECHGEVRFHEAAKPDSPPAHFEHRRSHDGCTRCDAYRGGPTSQHPVPLV